MDDGDYIEAGIRQIGSLYIGSIYIETVFMHPQYNSETFDNDIAIVKLKWPLTFNNNVKNACLPESSFVPQTKAVVSGWGKTIAGMYSTYLVQMSSIFSDGYCFFYNYEYQKKGHLLILLSRLARNPN